MSKKIRVAVIFGGKSAEHEVSIESAKNIYQSLDKNKYDIMLLGIDQQGLWHHFPSPKLLTTATHFETTVNSNLAIYHPHELSANAQTIDVIFPVLHGPNGEDGTIQGMLKLMGIPFVGANVLGSAVGMDKDVQKRLLKEAGLPIAKFSVLTCPVSHSPLPYPVFVKPANLGSSVGISKVSSPNELVHAVKTAFSYDTKIIIEEEIKGRELEVSVLGNTNPIASLPGEITTSHDFYDYDAKYLDENGAHLEIPANLSKEKIAEVQQLALRVFKTLCCEGLARVDFFLRPNGRFIVNELNTMPGFTNSSMYPKLWEASGLPQSKLLDTLISLALSKKRPTGL